MKKAITVFMILLAFCSINMGCGSKIPSQIKDNLSEVRVNIYEFSNDNISVNIITGEREDPYVLDGTAKGMTEYTVITMIPENPDNISAEITYNYLLKTGKKDYSGSFSMHPFGNSYAAEIGEKIDVKSVQLSVTATKDDWNFEENVVLESILTSEMIGWEDALLIGVEALKKATESMYDKKTLKAEVYVKLLCDPLGKTSDHFWYVAFADGTKIVSALIDPVSKKVLALKEE
ncbi:MAG: hypothetical protein GX756_05910 [Clostridiales bacterium]|nr:hypothetical protein [Clostridiales bacterium]